MKPSIPRDAIAEFCRRHHIRKLSLFGSVIRDDFSPDSDIDCLVEFEPNYTVGWGIVDIENELGQIFGGRRVDMLNPDYVNHRLRDRIVNCAELVYERPER